MAENVRPPVAIRIVRPYDTEDELLEHELETIGKTSVVLIGAHPRPTGVILRFEVTLASGATVLRGEGRVLAHKENAFRGQSGLTLRFTRLDPRSKAVVDRATSIRESRAQSEPTPSRPTPHRADGAIADALTASTPEPPVAADSTPSLDRPAPPATATSTPLRMGLTPPPVPVASRAWGAETARHDEPPTPAPTPVTSVPGEVAEVKRVQAAAPPKVAKPSTASKPAASKEAPASASPIEPPPDRADLLARLRERASNLAPERVEEILSARR